ncbi:MAG: DUF805 domain-containing protein [Henriciella sp.]|nr:DUF805 domain-containing protein [Henriciella sp.]
MWWAYVKNAIANAGNGAGRATRGEYAAYFSFTLVFLVIIFTVDFWPTSEAYTETRDVVAVVVIVCALPLYIPYIALSARRYHDFGWSGWYAILPIWPLLLLWPGNRGINHHGEPPHWSLKRRDDLKSRTFVSSVTDGVKSLTWLLP